MQADQIIHPVILAVPEADQKLVMQPKVAALRRNARKALAMSARYSGVILQRLDKAENGAPLPSCGIHWSLSHKEVYVAAVTSRKPVGIDIEHIKPVSEGVVKRTADQVEWDLAPQMDLPLFFRYWTAKEAVLKAVGKGLTGLDKCRVHRIVDDLHLILTYECTAWTVTHHWVGQDHLVAITSDDVTIEWHCP